LPSFSELTNVDWSLPEHQMWSGWEEFRQRNISISFEVVDHFSRAYPTLFNYLEENEESSAFVFVNFRSECDAVSKAIEELIIQKRLSFDQLVVHGRLDKHEKFGLISLFNGTLSMPDFIVRILIATAAANTGIDKDTIEMVIRRGVPRDLITAFQERGRNARMPGRNGAYNIYTNWGMFITLMNSIVLPLRATPDATDQADGANSAIATRSPALRARRVTNQTPSQSPLPLTTTQIHNNVVQSVSDVVDVLHLNCLPEFGCIHTRTEWFLQCGGLELPPLVIRPCETMCHVCTGSCRESFLPVIYSGAVKFMNSDRLRSTLPLVIDHDNSDSIINTLWEDKDRCKEVFGTKSPKRANCVGFFLQLIATKIISFELVDNRGLKCVIQRDDNDMSKYVYEDASRWAGIELRSPKRGGAKVSLNEIIAANKKAEDLLSEF
jgi:hypothetical protein